jgi:SAM-dependent methyltransferase
MAQITRGLRGVLSHPAAYSGFQTLMGANRGWQRITDSYLKMKAGEALLDIGCGPGDVLRFLPDVDYWGFDISKEYIARARLAFPDRGHFEAKLFEASDLDYLPKFDAALMSGVLHHLNDDQADELLGLISRALKPGGRLVTIDPCYAEKQNPVARFIISKDRGCNVRDEAGYKELVNQHFNQTRVAVVHKAWIPYTHCYTVCQNA